MQARRSASRPGSTAVRRRASAATRSSRPGTSPRRPSTRRTARSSRAAAASRSTRRSTCSSAPAEELDPERIEEAVAGVLPDPVREHYAVVRGRRYPPKQVLACVTGLNQADFTAHEARQILQRLGFVAVHAGRAEETLDEERRDWPHGGRQAAALAPYMGKWVALGGPLEVLVAAETPQEVVAWLAG